MPQPADRHERLLKRERATSRTLRVYFESQGVYLSDQIADVGLPPPDAVELIFNQQAAHDQLIEVVKPELVRTAIACGVTDAAQDLPGYIVPDVTVGIVTSFDLPDELRQAVNRAITEVTQQPYWRDVQSESSTIISDAIRDGMRQGHNAEHIARDIRDSFAENGKVRARRIARTETAAARNAGSLESARQASRDGLVIRKVWSSTADNSVRQTHMDADGQAVPQEAMFNVGAYDAPYPAYYGLPAWERINCRCGMFIEAV